VQINNIDTMFCHVLIELRLVEGMGMSEESPVEEKETTEDNKSTAIGCMILIVLGLLVFGTFKMCQGCSSSDGESDGPKANIESRIDGDAAYLTYEVGSYLAAERGLAFKDVTENVYNFLRENENVKSIDITMRVDCEDNYGNWKTKESHVKVASDDVLEMRKYANPGALEGCMDWQLAFEVGYKMCGQID